MDNSFALLVVSPRLPSPTGKADSRTVYHLIDYFVKRGHDIHLCTFHDNALRERNDLVEELKKKCRSVYFVRLRPWRSFVKMTRGLVTQEPLQVWYYRYSAMQNAVDRIITHERPDLFYAHLIRTAQYLLHHDSSPRVLGMQISFGLNYQRLVSHLKDPVQRNFYRLELNRVRNYEGWVAEQFDRTLLISPADKASIKGGQDLNNVFFNPHGIEVDYYAKDLGVPREENTIVLNADFEAPTNVDAALFFYEEIFPHIRSRIPHARFWLVGRKPPNVLKKIGESDPSVLVTGFVEDLRPYLQSATVAVDPLRVGAGLQNKILVSMAAGLPVVATAVANEGLRAPEGEVIVIADDPQEFANAVVELFKNPQRRYALACAASSWVKERWTWRYHFAKLREMFGELMTLGPTSDIEQYFPFSD